VAGPHPAPDPLGLDLLTQQKNAIPALEAKRQLGVPYNTAWTAWTEKFVHPDSIVVSAGPARFNLAAMLPRLGFAAVHTLPSLADGSRKRVPMVGPLRVHFEDRWCDLSALVFGDEPLLGAVPMEMMDLVLDPAAQRLRTNPENPYLPGTLAK